MSLQKFPDFLKLLSHALIDADSEQDELTTQQYVSRLNADGQDRLHSQIQALLQMDSLPLEAIGTESNRWFGSDDEAHAWLQVLLKGLGTPGLTAESDAEVKDSNGAILQEGDSVTVIKDLKVKGGTSDLKRGTLVKKIHLTSDPGMVECRVDGSTLVLKTEFLKKSV